MFNKQVLSLKKNINNVVDHTPKKDEVLSGEMYKKEFKNAHQNWGRRRFSLSLSRKYLLSCFDEYRERGQSREKKRFFKKRVLTVARLLDQRVSVSKLSMRITEKEERRRPFSFEEKKRIVTQNKEGGCTFLHFFHIFS